MIRETDYDWKPNYSDDDQSITRGIQVSANDDCLREACDGKYVTRYSRKNHEYFLACSNYPKCNETKSYF